MPLMLMVGEPHPHEAEQLLCAVLGDIKVCFCKPVQTIIIPHPFTLSAMFNQMTALLQDSEWIAPMWDVYLALLVQMFVSWTVSMEQYSQLQTHIHGSELPTQSEAAAAIFSQLTMGEASDEEAMSCDDEVSVMPPPVPKPSGSGQTLQGTALCQVLNQQPPSSLLPQQTPKMPASSGWTSVLEKLFRLLSPCPTLRLIAQRVMRAGAVWGANERSIPLARPMWSLPRNSNTTCAVTTRSSS